MIVSAVVPIFFLYFVLLSGSCSELINCGLQKHLGNTIAFRHMLIFLSIYLFTFVLNWYTFDSLQVTPLTGSDDEEETEDDPVSLEFNISKLVNWFYFSLLIYIIFLATTKTEVFSFYIFFAVVVLCCIFQIILKSVSTKKYHNVNSKLFISSNDYNDLNHNGVIQLHNTTTSLFTLSLVMVGYGCIKYYKRQRKDHKKDWDNLKFIFGTTKNGKECANL